MSTNIPKAREISFRTRQKDKAEEHIYRKWDGYPKCYLLAMIERGKNRLALLGKQKKGEGKRRRCLEICTASNAIPSKNFEVSYLSFKQFGFDIGLLG